MALQLADRSKHHIWLNGKLLFNKELLTQVNRGIEAYLAAKTTSNQPLAIVDARPPKNQINKHENLF